MALGHQLRDGALVEGPGDQQDDVIDHVAVPAGDEGAAAGGQVVLSVRMTPPLQNKLNFSCLTIITVKCAGFHDAGTYI